MTLVAFRGLLKILTACRSCGGQDSGNHVRALQQVEVVLVCLWQKFEIIKGAMDVQEKSASLHEKPQEDRVAETRIAWRHKFCVEVVHQQNLINNVSLRVVESHVPLCAINHE